MENGVKEEGEGQAEGTPDSSPQGPPDAVSPTPGLGEDDDDPLLEEGEVDMRAMMVAGGVMEFELLRLPPQSKTVGPWTFQQVLEGGLSLFPYPPDTRGASTTANGQQQLQGGGAGEGQPPQTPGNTTGPPVNITSKLPNDFLFNSEPKVAHWDPLHQYWTTNSVLGVDVNMEEGTFSCQVPSFSPLVLLADRHWNMPYHSWQLSPSGTDSTLLTVNGAHLQVKVEIKEDKCRLLPQPKPVPTEGGEGEGPFMNKMADQWMSTRDLMKSLLTSGVNIFPSNTSHKYVDLPDKSRTVEDQLCVHLAMLSGVFAFSWSKWLASPTLSRRQFVMRAAEWVDQGGAVTEQEPAWFLMVGGDRSFKLALTEKDEEFSDELRDDCEVHPDVYSCVVEGCPLETKEHLSTMTSPVHVDNVTQWLQTTRVLSYS